MIQVSTKESKSSLSASFEESLFVLLFNHGLSSELSLKLRRYPADFVIAFERFEADGDGGRIPQFVHIENSRLISPTFDICGSFEKSETPGLVSVSFFIFENIEPHRFEVTARLEQLRTLVDAIKVNFNQD